jgi:apurinic endonuclease APN1
MQNYGLHIASPKKTGVYKETPLTSMAFFLSSPQGWRSPNWSDKDVQRFTTSLDNCSNLSKHQLVVHGCYLINPASKRDDVVAKSKIRFVEELKLCDKLNVQNYVFHPGTNKDTQVGLQKSLDLINLGLQESKNVNILVENMTKTNTLCQTWQEVDWVIKHANNPRVGSCLDTAHCWGAGEKKGMFMDTLLNDYDRVVGLYNLKAIHLNDSKVEYGSNKDRHEDILKGKIPHSFWDNFILDKRVKEIPAILETPTNCRHVVTKIIQDNS